VEELQIYCCHGLTRVDSEEDFVLDDDGCPEIISLGHRDMHEESCQFALVPCPNGSNYCGKVRQKDLEEHLCNCVSFPCPFRESGEKSVHVYCKIFSFSTFVLNDRVWISRTTV
jgi:E3 ubiquitin-protein ligase TRAF7